MFSPVLADTHALVEAEEGGAEEGVAELVPELHKSAPRSVNCMAMLSTSREHLKASISGATQARALGDPQSGWNSISRRAA
jgi:hypothetical protein